MFALSEAAANWINDFANVALVLTAIFGALGTIALFFSTRSRDFYANEKAAAQEVKIATANESAAKANARAAELEAARIELELSLEAERNERERLRQAVSPRFIEQARLSAALKRFAGMEVTLFSVDDHEPNHVRGQLHLLFNMAGWKVIDSQPLSDEIIEHSGITVKTGLDDKSFEAANELVSQLNAMKNVEAKTALDKVSQDYLIIHIGRIPSQYFSDLARSETDSVGPANGERLDAQLHSVESTERAPGAPTNKNPEST
jgi:hypothetical protein